MLSTECFNKQFQVSRLHPDSKILQTPWAQPGSPIPRISPPSSWVLRLSRVWPRLVRRKVECPDFPLQNLQLVMSFFLLFLQWEFQDPKMEIPSIYKAYVWALVQGIYPQNMNLYGTVAPFQDPGIPIDFWGESGDFAPPRSATFHHPGQRPGMEQHYIALDTPFLHPKNLETRRGNYLNLALFQISYENYLNISQYSYDFLHISPAVWVQKSSDPKTSIPRPPLSRSFVSHMDGAVVICFLHSKYADVYINVILLHTCIHKQILDIYIYTLYQVIRVYYMHTYIQWYVNTTYMHSH